LIVWEVADEVGISRGSANTILTEDLDMRNVAAKFMPKLFSQLPGFPGQSRHSAGSPGSLLSWHGSLWFLAVSEIDRQIDIIFSGVQIIMRGMYTSYDYVQIMFLRTAPNCLKLLCNWISGFQILRFFSSLNQNVNMLCFGDEVVGSSFHSFGASANAAPIILAAALSVHVSVLPSAWKAYGTSSWN
jgi:hypothetical protein